MLFLCSFRILLSYCLYLFVAVAMVDHHKGKRWCENAQHFMKYSDNVEKKILKQSSRENNGIS